MQTPAQIEARLMFRHAMVNHQVGKWRSHTGQSDSAWKTTFPHANLAVHPDPGARMPVKRMNIVVPEIKK